MDNPLTSIFNGEVPPGVYRLEGGILLPREVRNWVKEAQVHLFYLDGVFIHNGLEFGALLKKALEFSYMGENWNAVYDCLTDLPHITDGQHGYLVLYTNFQNFADKDNTNFSLALEVMANAVDFWKDTSTPMYFVLQGDSSFVPSVKRL